MAAVTFERRSAIKSAKPLIPAKLTGSLRDFRPPPTIQSDFRRLLQHDVPFTNFTFELLHNWYDAEEDGYTPVYIRAQQTPIDWKSKIGNSDMNTNFKTTHDVPVRKGDMVIREDGIIFILNWNVQNHPNNQATQSLECNTELEFTREVPDTTDANGYLVKSGGREVIVPTIPASHTEYAGRPDYADSQGLPGVHADHLITVYLQWNNTTKNIDINDEFIIGQFTYRVINISISEVNITKDHGVLVLNAKRVAGATLKNEPNEEPEPDDGGDSDVN